MSEGSAVFHMRKLSTTESADEQSCNGVRMKFPHHEGQDIAPDPTAESLSKPGE